ncbi:putative recombination initiation defects 3 isoform X4 [Magnolia sinica]|uniref:putative recombination initiation defects 3 isoform X4 n=1 Tax=Magnolia sinica TaxID=86752 RepID=UPI002657D942|nr:putative recombination initiation defects 3 isoform X4 [Magnolia sinica]
MKLKINKACDLSSIFVLPPHSRRGNAIPPGADTSVFGKSQGSLQFRSHSQQSFTQGMSMSQLSQNSQEEIVTNEHRFGSQDNSLKRISCLAPVTYTQEDTQMPMSRSSNNVIRRWSSTSAPDNRCHVSEELEHRIRLMETSLNRLGMVLKSVQSDVMQVNKAVKEVSLES